ncbi:MAG: NAD-dependent epimerase/dehydratase family protein, partial [Methanobacteriota archaeon]
IVRPFNNYGPRQNDGTYAGVIPITMRRLLQGERAVVHGDGEQTRDYVYVEDTAEAAILAYERRSTRGRAVNVASGRGTTINELVGILVKATGSTHPVAHGPPRPGDVRHQCGDGAAAERLLGFRPSTSMEEGLRKTVHWYRENSLAVRAPGPIPKA